MFCQGLYIFFQKKLDMQAGYFNTFFNIEKTQSVNRKVYGSI